jgi:hypothetical protein
MIIICRFPDSPSINDIYTMCFKFQWNSLIKKCLAFNIGSAECVFWRKLIGNTVKIAFSHSITSKLHAQIAYYYHTYLQLFFPPYHIFPYIGNNNYPLLSCQCEVWNSDRSYDLGRISKHYENDIVCCLGLWLWSSYVLGIAMKTQSLSF